MKKLTLTPLQRFTAYCIMLSEFEQNTLNTTYGFCMYINYRFDIFVYRSQTFKRAFPELYAQKPEKKHNRYFWWRDGDTKPRIAALKRAISLVGEKL